VTFDGAAGAANSLSVIDEGTIGSRQFDVGSASITALQTGLIANPTVNWSGVKSVSLTGRSSGGETILAQNTSGSSPASTTTTTTLYIAPSDSVNVQGTANPLIIDGTATGANFTSEEVTAGSLAPSLGGTLANITAPVTVNNVFSLTADDSGDATGRTGTISASSITGFGLPASVAINYNTTLSALTVEGGKGGNTETVTGTTAATTLYPGASAASTVFVKATTGALTINGNGRADTIDVGSLAPAPGGTLSGIGGTITITNTASASNLSLDDSGDTTGRIGAISAWSVTGFGLRAAVDYTGSQLKSLAVRGGGGSNTDAVTGTSTPTTLYPNAASNEATVNVQWTAAPLTINGNAFPEAINIGSLAPSLGGTLAAVAGPITVTNTSADSTLSLDDTADTANRTGTISPTSITGFGLGAPVDYTGSELASLTVRGGEGTNTDNVTGTSAPTSLYPNVNLNEATVNVHATNAPLTINGNTFQEAINIGSLAPSLGGTLTAIAGSITVTNTSRNSTLNLDDSGGTLLQTGTISATSVAGLDLGAAVNYTGSQVASLSVTGPSDAIVTVTGTSAATTLVSNAGYADVFATTAPLTLNGFHDVLIGDGAPPVNPGTGSGMLSNIAGSIADTNTNTDSILALDDSGDTNFEVGTLTATSISGLGLADGAVVNYNGSELGDLFLYGGAKGAQLKVLSESITPGLFNNITTIG
jgi:hypothetical protein